MKIEKIKLKNFRSYKWEIEIPFKNMNIILWKNDIWKSTILEALDIFFNDWKWCVSISKEDLNKDTKDENIEITVCFSEFTDDIILESIPTSLSWEYLLNSDWFFEVKKIYSWSTMKASTYIVANHPSNDTFLKELLIKKIKELQKYITDNWIIVSWDSRVSSVLRQNIRNSYSKLFFELQEIPANWDWIKELWEQIQLKLPVYTLFQSDRSNSDQDNEVQNPMNIALKNILAKPEISKKLNEVFNRVKREMEEVANGTLLKLHWINPNLADELSPKLPDFEKLSWNKAFSKTEITSDEIPLNKRWSWVKRMVLLSFFLNEVERRKREEWLADIIYAFEEPETSQHPGHQEILIDAFNSLSQEVWVQVILTTHSPYVYKKLTKKPNINLLYVYNDSWNKKIEDIFLTFNLFPHSPSWGEINYFVYWLPTFEFFDELYSRLEELNDTWNHVDDYIVQESVWTILKNTPRIKLNKLWVQCTIQHTYITCIRHQIHHSDNTFNPDYKCRLEEGIKDMIYIINSKI